MTIQRRDEKLQEKLDEMLAQVIGEFEALGYEHYPIQPRVRITNNKSRLGSAQAVNGAVLAVPRQGRKRGKPFWKDGVVPEFRISISRRECGDDASIRNVLFHEVIHTSEGCFDHGRRFKELAAAVNAAYGVHVTTSKKPEVQTGADLSASELKDMLSSHIGESFSPKRKRFVFVGFNAKPKYCCVLEDEAGRRYTAPALTVAEGLGLLHRE